MTNHNILKLIMKIFNNRKVLWNASIQYTIYFISQWGVKEAKVRMRVRWLKLHSLYMLANMLVNVFTNVVEMFFNLTNMLANTVQLCPGC